MPGSSPATCRSRSCSTGARRPRRRRTTTTPGTAARRHPRQRLPHQRRRLRGVAERWFSQRGVLVNEGSIEAHRGSSGLYGSLEGPKGDRGGMRAAGSLLVPLLTTSPSFAEPHFFATSGYTGARDAAGRLHRRGAGCLGRKFVFEKTVVYRKGVTRLHGGLKVCVGPKGHTRGVWGLYGVCTTSRPPFWKPDFCTSRGTADADSADARGLAGGRAGCWVLPI